MTDGTLTTNGCLSAAAAAVTDADSARDIQTDVCTSLVDCGFEYAAFETDHGVVERGTDPGDCATVPVTHGGVEYGALTVGPADDPDLGEVVDLAAYGLASIAAADQREDRIEDQKRKVHKLHSIAARMVECENDGDVFALGIDAAENILEFDICSIDTVEDGYIVPQIVSTGLPDEESAELAADEGIAGRTIQEDRSVIVDDVTTHPEAEPVNPEYRSVLSVPIEGHGVFQAGARQVSAFDETDAELAELLMTHVSQSLDRLERAAQLRESEQKYRTLVEQSHEAVAIYQAAELAFVNARAEALLERDRDELLGTDPVEFVHPDDKAVVEDVVGTLSSGENAQTTYEVRLVTASGDERYCECSASNITYQGEAATLLSVRDVTERKRRQRELERQNERLEEFASVVSHDLRNPLNVARGSADLAAATGEDEHFDRLDDALDRMEDLVEDVLELARQGKLVDETETVDLEEVVDCAWQSVETRDARLTVEVEGVTVDADPVRLQELFENLFRNSVEHGPLDPAEEDGDRNISVTVGALTDQQGFYVEDDGVGIPADQRDDVFARGVSTSADGTGFGLAIVDSIAAAHGWDVRVADAPGARFEVLSASMF